MCRNRSAFFMLTFMFEPDLKHKSVAKQDFPRLECWKSATPRRTISCAFVPSAQGPRMFERALRVAVCVVSANRYVAGSAGQFPVHNQPPRSAMRRACRAAVARRRDDSSGREFCPPAGGAAALSKSSIDDRSFDSALLEFSTAPGWLRTPSYKVSQDHRATTARTRSCNCGTS